MPAPANRSCRSPAVVSTRSTRSAGGARRALVVGVELRVLVQIHPEERRHLDGRGRRHGEPNATTASVRAAACGSPASEGDTTSCFQRRSECSRANSRERASRSPMRFTAIRNASSGASPALGEHCRPAHAGGPRTRPRRRSGSPAGGGGSSATGRSAPREMRRSPEPASSDSPAVAGPTPSGRPHTGRTRPARCRVTLRPPLAIACVPRRAGPGPGGDP